MNTQNNIFCNATGITMGSNRFLDSCKQLKPSTMGNAQAFTVHTDIKVLSDCGKNRLLCVLTASINTLNVSAAATMNQPGDLFYKVHC